jgi:hypothetical protein
MSWSQMALANRYSMRSALVPWWAASINGDPKVCEHAKLDIRHFEKRREVLKVLN